MIYEKLDVWKKSKELAVSVYKQMASCKDFGFKDQITRCSLSVVSNIADKIAGANFECWSLRRQPER